MNKNTSISLGNYFDQFVKSKITESSFVGSLNKKTSVLTEVFHWLTC